MNLGALNGANAVAATRGQSEKIPGHFIGSVSISQAFGTQSPSVDKDGRMRS
jgi:hypothetical protein